MEKRKSVYYLESVGNFDALEESVKQIKGVLSAFIDRDDCCLSYEIDEWSSDYDVFTEVLRLAESVGCVIDFEKSDKKSEEAKAEKLDEKAAEKAVNATTANDFGEASPETLADKTEGEQEGDGKPIKRKRVISEALQNLIIFSAGLVALIIGYVVKSSSAKTVMFALAFALSGYELLYDITCDVLKKRILTPELIALLGVVAALFLGYAEQAVTAILLLVALRNCISALKKFVLKGTPAFDIDEKVSVLIEKNGKKREAEELVCNVKEGDVLSYRKGEKCRFDCVLVSDFATVLRGADGGEDGEFSEVELKKGDKVFKGEELLSTANVRVKKGYLSELSGFERAFVARVREKSAVSAAFEKKRAVVCSAVIAVCLLITFVLPAFSSSYVTGLYRWGYFAAIVAVVLGGGKIIDIIELAVVSSLACGYKNGIIAFGQGSYLKAAECKLVALDKENALDLPDGEIKSDCSGAMRELKDCGKRLALLTLLSGEKASELCSGLKIHEYYCFNGEQEKTDKIKELCTEAICVTGEKTACGLSVALCGENCEDLQGSRLQSSAIVFNGEIAFAPYAVKLAKRAARAKKLSLALGLAVKAAAVIVAALGVGSLWWLALADVLTGAACAVVSALLGKAVY